MLEHGDRFLGEDVTRLSLSDYLRGMDEKYINRIDRLRQIMELLDTKDIQTKLIEVSKQLHASLTEDIKKSPHPPTFVISGRSGVISGLFLALMSKDIPELKHAVESGRILIVGDSANKALYKRDYEKKSYPLKAVNPISGEKNHYIIIDDNTTHAFKVQTTLHRAVATFGFEPNQIKQIVAVGDKVNARSLDSNIDYEARSVDARTIDEQTTVISYDEKLHEVLFELAHDVTAYVQFFFYQKATLEALVYRMNGGVRPVEFTKNVSTEERAKLEAYKHVEHFFALTELALNKLAQILNVSREEVEALYTRATKTDESIGQSYQMIRAASTYSPQV